MNKHLFIPIFAFLLVCLMPSSESLWIDEGVDSIYAKQENLAARTSHIRSETKSQAQMPLPMLSLWAWAQVAGTSEYALRAVNILWGGITVFFFLSDRAKNPVGMASSGRGSSSLSLVLHQ